LIVIYFLSIGFLNAEPQTGIINHETNTPLLEAEIDDNTYYGVCLNNDKHYPENTEYIITNGAGNTSEHVKNIIIKYYRENNTDRYNSLIQFTVWSSIRGQPTVYGFMTEEEIAISLQMYNDQRGVVGNTYTDENGITYIFAFKYGTPLTDTTRQDALLFSYITEEIQNSTVNQKNLNKTNQIVTSEETKESKESKELSDSKQLSSSVDSIEPKNHGIVNMKTTGISLITGLMVLLISLGFVIPKK